MDALEVYPDIAPSARATRAFLVRAVRYLAAEAGVRQFLDIGSGLSAAGNANTHEAAFGVCAGYCCCGAPTSKCWRARSSPRSLIRQGE
jgi:hypothetical protein